MSTGRGVLGARSWGLVAAAVAAATLWGCGENTTPAAATADTGADTGAADPDTGLPVLTCLPNLDGEITADEMQAVIGVPATYFVSAEGSAPAVDLQGQEGVGGERAWDFSARSASDAQLALAAQPLTGKWYADQFPSADFVVAFNTSGTLEAIYRKDEQRFDLLGLASAEPDPPQGRTLMVYQSPVMLYQFPVKVGQQWVASSTVTEATLNGLPYAGRDTYEVSVEAIGDLKLPELTFRKVLMARTRVTLQPSVGVSVTQQQVSFLFECYGEVARVTSAPGEQEPFFTQAQSLRRLGIPE
jgi:hypothetical protein